MKGKVLSAALLALTVVAVACGSASKPLSASDFRRQANAACREMQARTARLQRDMTRAKLADAMVAIADAELRRLGALRPPQPLEARFAHLKALLSTERDYVANILRRGHATDAETRANFALVHRIAPAAQALDLPACI
jgi:hypothetical protein